MSIAHRAYITLGSIFSNLDQYVVERELRKMGVGHARCIPTHTTIAELHTLFRLAQGCPSNANVLEIGSYLGASTCYIAAGVAQHGGKVFCVDTWLNETMPEGLRDTLAEFGTNTAPVSPWLQVIRKRSEDLTEDDVSKPLCLAFIDGDHSYQAVKSDFLYATSLLRSDGIIAFHDVRYFHGVSCLVGEALMSGKWLLAGYVENLCWIKRAPQAWTAFGGQTDTLGN